MYVCIYMYKYICIHIHSTFAQLVQFEGWGDEWLDDLHTHAHIDTHTHTPYTYAYIHTHIHGAFAAGAGREWLDDLSYIQTHTHTHISHTYIHSHTHAYMAPWQLVLFGGWGDEWLDDLYGLDVSGIVGPPYAVQKLIPGTGPISGNTKVSEEELCLCIWCVHIHVVLYIIQGWSFHYADGQIVAICMHAHIHAYIHTNIHTDHHQGLELSPRRWSNSGQIHRRFNGRNRYRNVSEQRRNTMYITCVGKVWCWGCGGIYVHLCVCIYIYIYVCTYVFECLCVYLS